MRLTLRTMAAAPIVAMAAIPVLMGAIIFAPVYIPLALVCAWLDDAPAEQNTDARM